MTIGRMDSRHCVSRYRRLHRMQLAIPDSLEQLDAAWMTAALGKNYPGIEVSELAVETVVHGAGTKAKLRLSFGAGDGSVDPIVWVKAGWEPHSEWLGASRIYAREAFFLSRSQRQIEGQCTSGVLCRLRRGLAGHRGHGRPAFARRLIDAMHGSRKLRTDSALLSSTWRASTRTIGKANFLKRTP